MSNREDLHKLVDGLPEEALATARKTLQYMQTWPPKIKAALAAAGTGESGAAIRNGHVTRSRIEKDGTQVVETRRMIEGHSFRVVEKFRLSADGKKIHYGIRVAGGKRQIQEEVEFEVDAAAVSGAEGKRLVM